MTECCRQKEISMKDLLLILLCVSATFGDAAGADKPNIVFILADDLGYMDVGAFNPKTFYETPHIDSLAKRGMKFTQGYAACCVCSPTRGSIMTGKYPPRFGITNFIGGASRANSCPLRTWSSPTRGGDDRGSAARFGLLDFLRRQMASRHRRVLSAGTRFLNRFAR